MITAEWNSINNWSRTRQGM